jgi:hypothetical protein
MNKEQQELIEEGFKNYYTQMDKIMLNNLPYEKGFDTGITDYKMEYFWSGEEFVDKCKTDDKFSKTWGLKIEERELSLEERYDLIENDKHIQFVTWQSHGTNRIKEVMDKREVPSKLITITYKDKTITSYE